MSLKSTKIFMTKHYEVKQNQNKHITYRDINMCVDQNQNSVSLVVERG